jgi:hypothetical protein
MSDELHPTSLQGLPMSNRIGRGQLIPFPGAHIQTADATYIGQGQSPVLDQTISRLRNLMDLAYNAMRQKNWIVAADYAEAWYSFAQSIRRQSQKAAIHVAVAEADRCALISDLSEHLKLAHILLRPGYECRDAREHAEQMQALGAIAVMQRVRKPLVA